MTQQQPYPPRPLPDTPSANPGPVRADLAWDPPGQVRSLLTQPAVEPKEPNDDHS